MEKIKIVHDKLKLKQPLTKQTNTKRQRQNLTEEVKDTHENTGSK